ncbi:MAG: LEA type 2 family protein [Acidobacteriota bacterium]|nr:LEA type 2 family protein [Acidobacteriota bacterium]
MSVLLILVSLAFAMPASDRATGVGLEIDPSPGDSVAVAFTGPAGNIPTGDFRGRVSAYGSAVELPISGRAERARGGLRIRGRIRYADLPEDWGSKVRPDGLDFRLRGAVGNVPVDWTARVPWGAVEVAGEQEALGRFLSLKEIELTSLSPASSRGVARLEVVNPFAFPLRIASSEYRIEASGRSIGDGSTRGLLLRARQSSTLDFPIRVEHSQLIGAAGSAFLMSGEIDARLVGSLTVRLPGGDFRVPLDLAGRISTGN